MDSCRRARWYSEAEFMCFDSLESDRECGEIEADRNYEGKFLNANLVISKPKSEKLVSDERVTRSNSRKKFNNVKNVKVKKNILNIFLLTYKITS